MSPPRRPATGRGRPRGPGPSDRVHRAAAPDRRPGRRGEDGLGGDQVEGRHAVRELLEAGRRRVRELVVEAGAEDAGMDALLELAERNGVPLRVLEREAFARRCRTDVPQGVLARADPLLPVELDALCEGPGVPFLVALDSVTDPHNLGAVLRTALGAGATGIVLPRHRQVHLTPAVMKAAAGAAEHLEFALVPGLPNALERLSRERVWSVGLEAAGRVSLDEVTVFDQPVVLVFGSEGGGLSALVRQRCDLLARIEMVGPLESLNVSASAAVACFAVARARRSAFS